MPFAFSADTIRVLRWLWFLPWASAADIARVTGIPEQSVSNILNRRRKAGWLKSARLGRGSKSVDRFVFSNTGIQEVQDRWRWQLFWWHSPSGLRRLAGRLEVVEMAYLYLPRLWRSNLVSEPTCWVYEDRPDISERTGEPIMRAALVKRDWRRGSLVGFCWMQDGPFEAIAIYRNRDRNDGSLFLPILWLGNFQRTGDISDVRSEMRSALIEDERWSKLPQAQALSVEHLPGLIIFCTDRGSAATAQRHWLQSFGREKRTTPAIIDAQGQVVRSMAVPTSWWQDFHLPPHANAARLGNIAVMVDGLTRGVYAALNGVRAWRMFRALDGSPAVTLAQLAEAVGVSPTVARKLLDPMVKARAIARKDSAYYLDELGSRMLADSQHVDIRRINRRWAVYMKRLGEYRSLQRRHNQGQLDAILYLRRHGYDAFPAMGVVIEYHYNYKRIRVTPDAFVILPPGVLVAIEFERSAKAPSRVESKAWNYGRLADIGRPIPVLFITETEEAARNFANLGYPYLLAATLDTMREGPHGRAVLEDNLVAGDPGCWFYKYNNRRALSNDAPIDMWSQIYAERHPEGRWRVPMERPFRLV